jgi:hypothetical protein
LIGSIEFTVERPLRLASLDRATGTPLIASNGDGYLVAGSGGLSTFVLPLDRHGRGIHDRGSAVDAGISDRAARR